MVKIRNTKKEEQKDINLNQEEKVCNNCSCVNALLQVIQNTPHCIMSNEYTNK